MKTKARGAMMEAPAVETIFRTISNGKIGMSTHLSEQRGKPHTAFPQTLMSVSKLRMAIIMAQAKRACKGMNVAGVRGKEVRVGGFS